MTAKAVIEDHGLLQGLGDDDHAQYLLLAGRAGGQVAYGGTAITDDLDLYPNTQSPPVDFATDGFVNLHGRILFLGFTNLTNPPGINYQLMNHNEVCLCTGQASIIPQGFWYTPTFQFNTAQTFGGSATFQDGSIWYETALITGSHGTFSLGSFLGGPRYQIGHAGAGLPPSGLYGFNATPAADLMGGSALTMPVMSGYTTNFPFPLQAFLALEPLRNGVVCTRYSHFKAYSNITHALTLQGGSTITTEVGLDLQNLARGTAAITVFSDALGAYMDHAGLITYTGGVLRLGTTAVTGHSLGAGDVILGGKLEVDGLSYFDAETRVSAKAVIQQSGGTPGTHEIQMIHGGSDGTVESMAGSLKLKAAGATTDVVQLISGAGTAFFGEVVGNNTFTHFGSNTFDLGIFAFTWRGCYLGEDAGSGLYLGASQEGRFWYDKTTTDTLRITGTKQLVVSTGLVTRLTSGAEVDSADAIYFGDPTTDGSWRIIRDTNDFSFQRQESSVWVEKGAFTAV